MSKSPKPSHQLNAYLDDPVADVSDAVKSWAGLTIYKKACKVLSMPFDKRREAIEIDPHRERLKAEVRRVFEYRAKRK